MKQILYILFLLSSILSFGQEKNIKTKTIRGFIFGDVSYVKTKIPVFDSDILIIIKGTERITKTDKYGKFQIEANEGDEMIIIALGFAKEKMLITDKNCYKIFLSTPHYDVWESRKSFRKNSKYFRKVEKEVLKNEKNGIYDCFD